MIPNTSKDGRIKLSGTNKTNCEHGIFFFESQISVVYNINDYIHIFRSSQVDNYVCNQSFNPSSFALL